MKNLILIFAILFASVSFSKGQSQEFIKNQGQIMDVEGNACDYIFYHTSAGGTENYLQADKISYVFSLTHPEQDRRDSVPDEPSDSLFRIDLNFLNASASELEPESQTEGLINYYTNGNEITNVPAYEKVTYKDIYDDIDLEITNSGDLHYKFIVSSGANPNNIKFDFEGVSRAYINASGDIVAETPLGDVVLPAPIAYLNDGTVPPNYVEIEFIQDASGFSISTEASGDISIEIRAATNPQTPMPTTVCNDYFRTWSTYYGGSLDDKALDLVMDSQGRAYVCGHTRSALFPTFLGIYMGPFDTWDAFVIVFNQNKSRRFATYFGGHGYDEADGIEVASGGDIFFVGI
ncbi:MAG: hypothetical protein JJE25_11245, partial [Bacteroidia bacterium]|nr:hypothetical protein [Bacteroidia bacterium]